MEPDWQDSMTRDCPKGVYARITPKETNGASAVGVLHDSILPDLATTWLVVPNSHVATSRAFHMAPVTGWDCGCTHTTRSAVTLTGPDRPGPFLLIEDVKTVTSPNRHYVSYHIR